MVRMIPVKRNRMISSTDLEIESIFILP